jgi:hypothetical protein
LLARLRAVLRRTTSIEDEPPIVTDDFVIELADRRIVRADGVEVQLSPIEWKLVETLTRRAGHLVTREELLSWNPITPARGTSSPLPVSASSSTSSRSARPSMPRQVSSTLNSVSRTSSPAIMLS